MIFIFIILLIFCVGLYRQIQDKSARGLRHNERVRELGILCGESLEGLKNRREIVEELWKMRFIGLLNNEFYMYVKAISNGYYRGIVEMGRSFLIDMDAKTAARISKRLDRIEQLIFEF
jgi:hypothetical protein